MNRLSEAHTPATDFGRYLTERAAASDAYVNGDVAPLNAIASHGSPDSIFPPSGQIIEGPSAVDDFNSKGAASFAPGADNELDIRHFGSSGDLAYWTGLQQSTVILGGEKVAMTLRITELFRLEGGQWRLFHRHADRASVES